MAMRSGLQNLLRSTNDKIFKNTKKESVLKYLRKLKSTQHCYYLKIRKKYGIESTIGVFTHKYHK